MFTVSIVNADATNNDKHDISLSNLVWNKTKLCLSKAQVGPTVYIYENQVLQCLFALVLMEFSA